ncbi:MAG: YraN family protein [Alphaproteobacteria bacterium]|nr:YraN family protein [Alphaproteobacteria bacterium]
MSARGGTAGRIAAERQGRRAEWLAGLWLSLRGFQILARRFKAAGGEIDLVARRGRLLVFAEVKARPRLDDGVFAVTACNRRRVEAAGRAFVARHPRLAGFAMRYDIIAVAGWRLRHAPDAWREDDV